MDKLSKAQVDRAVGSVLAGAVGDALGSAYEFGPARDDEWYPDFGVGYFGHSIGEWTDDTSMAIAILEWVAAGGQLPKRHILERWLEWSGDAKDVGVLTRAVLQNLHKDSPDIEALATATAYDLHTVQGKSAGNGSLMRIGPYALKNLGGELDVKELGILTRWTHYDEDNVKACRFWLEAIREAILEGGLDIALLTERSGMAEDELWKERLSQAQKPGARARDFSNNGWVVEALQGALTAILIRTKRSAVGTGANGEIFSFAR